METITVAHTPTPWAIHSTGSHLGIKAGKAFVFRKVVSGLSLEEFRQLEADFRHIVEAVNNFAAHRELLAERDRLQEKLDEDSRQYGEEAKASENLRARCEELEGALRDLFNMVEYALQARDALLISKTCETMEIARALLAEKGSR